jgi:hypothetical protein
MIGPIEAAGCFGAGEPAFSIAPVPGSSFKCPKQCATYAPKSCVRRYIVQSDFSGIGDKSHGQNFAVLNGDENRVPGLINP